MARRIVEIAEAVAASLASDGATVSLAPDFDLRDLAVRKVVVVPVGVTHHLLSRGHRQDDYTVQVGVLQRATEDDLEDLLAFVETLATGFLEQFLAGARCHKVAHDPLFVPDHLQERRQFTSVITLTFSEVVRSS